MTGRTAKRSRADSSPIAGKQLDHSRQYHNLTYTDRVRVIVSRNASQIDLPLPRDPTPTPSELGLPSTSAPSSDVESVDTTATKTTEGTCKSVKEKDRRNRAKIRRQNAADPAAELSGSNMISSILSHNSFLVQPHESSGSRLRLQQLTRDMNILSLTTVQRHRNIIFLFAKRKSSFCTRRLIH